MDLRSRLARLDPLARRDGAAPERPAEAPTLDDLGLVAAEGRAGRFWYRETRAALPPPPSLAALRAVAPRLPRGAAPGDLLFLDTETTGLAGGTGTLAFLVGTAWWRDGALQGRQYLLPSPAAERAMLHELAELAAGFDVVVTYNGNGFDLPLLRTRGILARRRGLLADLASLDLLPVARRLWGRRLADCRQGTVERDVGYEARDDRDIPGHLIPQAWFAFVRDGRRGPLSRVLEHNRWDVEGMAALLGAATARTALLEGPPRPLPWQDAWSLARLAERGGRRVAEVAWIRAALDALPAGEAPAEPRFGADAVRLLKRARDWERVAALLESSARRLGETPWYHLESAILYEHRLGDPRRALPHALALADAHRIARLEKRLERCAGSGDPR